MIDYIKYKINGMKFAISLGTEKIIMNQYIERKGIMRNLPVLAFTLLASSVAHSVTFDFADVADNLNDPLATYGLVGGERGATAFTFTRDGISATTTGFNGVTGAVYSAYLDSSFSGREGGLGVCQILNGDQCAPSSDDNVTTNESLLLTFDQLVTIDTTTFVNGNHGTMFSNDFQLSIDGGAMMTYALTNVFTTNLTGTTFEFFNPNMGGGSAVSNDQQFYINTLEVTAVPVPAAVWLFGTGLIGLVGVARRKA